MTEWYAPVDNIIPHIVSIETAAGSGTGFMAVRDEHLAIIFTAAHVISQAARLQQTVRLEHYASKKTVILPIGKTDEASYAGAYLEENMDTAALSVGARLLPFPSESPHLITKDTRLKVGNPMGWLGFPSISPERLCFFHGYTSCWLPEEKAYLIDGVSIPGVSGGPAFYIPEKKKTPHIAGIVSAYRYAKSPTGDTLPGASLVRDITQIHWFKSVFKKLGWENPPFTQ